MDSFKQYNDTHGHMAGDRLLHTLGKILTERLRSCAMVARYGGEEFVMLLPETPKEGALVVAEKIRRRIEDHPFPGRDTQPDGKVTVSLGVVTFPQDGSNRGTLMQRADQALYQAKQDGRNRVCAGVESLGGEPGPCVEAAHQNRRPSGRYSSMNSRPEVREI